MSSEELLADSETFEDVLLSSTCGASAERCGANKWRIRLCERNSQEFISARWCMRPRCDLSATPVLVYFSGGSSSNRRQSSVVFPDPVMPTMTVVRSPCLRLLAAD